MKANRFLRESFREINEEAVVLAAAGEDEGLDRITSVWKRKLRESKHLMTNTK
jgi:hypothetical protein